MLRDTVEAGGGVQFRQDPTTGILTFWDTSRSMFVGVDRENYEYGINHKNIRVPMWMMITSRIKSLAKGNVIPRNAMITCLTASAKALTNCEFEIYINNVLNTSVVMLTANKHIDESLSIPLNLGDELSVLCNPLNGQVINYPSLTIEVAWR